MRWSRVAVACLVEDNIFDRDECGCVAEAGVSGLRLSHNRADNNTRYGFEVDAGRGHSNDSGFNT